MKANELMIGDWLTANRRECVGNGGQFIAWKEIGKIARIYEDAVMLLFPTREDDYWEEMYLMDVEPIQLTPEILEKNGWEKRPTGYVFYTDGKRYDNSLWYIFGSNTFVVNTAEFQIKYVHELQHALKLCGIEKNIEL